MKERYRVAKRKAGPACFAMVLAGSVPGALYAQGKVELTVAMAANPQMQVAESLIDDFYKDHPDIHVNFQILPENQLRPTILRDVATKSGQFDVVMLGAYEVPLWAAKGWTVDLTKDYIKGDEAWDVGDISKPILDIMSYKGDVYAAPFYGSSSFLFYRKDLFQKAGLTMPAKPTWAEVADFAEKLDDDAAGQSGICLRGIPGWGQSLAPLTTVINTFGGRWFDENWQPQLTAPKTKEAIAFYVDLLREHGQADAASSGWQECLQLMTQGKTAMWYDDTVFAGPVLDQALPELEGDIGFAPAPVNATDAPGWLWAWGLAIPETSPDKDAAWEFISWVTSKDYIQLAGQKAGWAQIPPGSRASTYQIPEYQAAAESYADLTLQAIQSANPQHPTVDPVPYTGVQYVSIPEFEQIGEFVSQQLAGAISGSETLDDALAASETRMREIMDDAGYYN